MLTGNRYTWAARYEDGSRLYQIDADGVKHAYEDIDRSRIVAFEMYEEGRMIFWLPVTKNQQFFWRRRTEMTPGAERTDVCHIIGKRENVGGLICWGVFGLFESDGHLEVSGQLTDDHPWFYPPTFREEERGPA